MDTIDDSIKKAAQKRGDTMFETAPRAGMVRIMSWAGLSLIAIVVLADIWIFDGAKAPRQMAVALSVNVGIVAIVALSWFASRIRGITLSGQTLLIRLTFWTARFDLGGLQSVEADANVFKGSLRTFGNGGLGAFHGYFYSKHMGKFRGYVTDTNRAVVLRSEGRCVVVSPKDTDYFVEEVCKRTGARLRN